MLKKFTKTTKKFREKFLPFEIVENWHHEQRWTDEVKNADGKDVAMSIGSFGYEGEEAIEADHIRLFAASPLLLLAGEKIVAAKTKEEAEDALAAMKFAVKEATNKLILIHI